MDNEDIRRYANALARREILIPVGVFVSAWMMFTGPRNIVTSSEPKFHNVPIVYSGESGDPWKSLVVLCFLFIVVRLENNRGALERPPDRPHDNQPRPPGNPPNDHGGERPSQTLPPPVHESEATRCRDAAVQTTSVRRHGQGRRTSPSVTVSPRRQCRDVGTMIRMEVPRTDEGVQTESVNHCLRCLATCTKGKSMCAFPDNAMSSGRCRTNTASNPRGNGNVVNPGSVSSQGDHSYPKVNDETELTCQGNEIRHDRMNSVRTHPSNGRVVHPGSISPQVDHTLHKLPFVDETEQTYEPQERRQDNVNPASNLPGDGDVVQPGSCPSQDDNTSEDTVFCDEQAAPAINDQCVAVALDVNHANASPEQRTGSTRVQTNAHRDNVPPCERYVCLLSPKLKQHIMNNPTEDVEGNNRSWSLPRQPRKTAEWPG